jgi:aspartyl-tRNA(Asn)/glutamyl-tRNA(Gln) amidotransferase subunit A
LSATSLERSAALADRWEPWLQAIVTWVGRAGDAGALTGVVLGVKDILSVEGVPRRCGTSDDAPPSDMDAAAVASLGAAGVAVAATTATHQYALGVTTPRVRNPRSETRIAGGSSGGSAAALAAGIVDLALGTDTGGSLRIPAASCGVVGYKPTYGSVSTVGLQPLAPSLDTVGPMARSVLGCAQAMRFLLPTIRDAQEPRRIGVMQQMATAPLDADVRACWEASLRALNGSGGTLVDVDLPAFSDANVAAGRILATEAYAVHRSRFSSEPQHFSDDVAAVLAYGGAMSPGKLVEARKVQRRLESELQRAWAVCDVLVVPTLPCRVPERGRRHVTIGGRREATAATLTKLTNPWNLVGAPAGSVPCGRDRAGGPIGIQVIGRSGHDGTVLAGMAQLERLAGGPWPPEQPRNGGSRDRGSGTHRSRFDGPIERFT